MRWSYSYHYPYRYPYPHPYPYPYPYPSLSSTQLDVKAQQEASRKSWEATETSLYEEARRSGITNLRDAYAHVLSFGKVSSPHLRPSVAPQFSSSPHQPPPQQPLPPQQQPPQPPMQQPQPVPVQLQAQQAQQLPPPPQQPPPPPQKKQKLAQSTNGWLCTCKPIKPGPGKRQHIPECRREMETASPSRVIVGDIVCMLPSAAPMWGEWRAFKVTPKGVTTWTPVPGRGGGAIVETYIVGLV